MISYMFKSLANRKLTSFLTIAVICASTMLYLSIEQIQNSVRNSFLQTVSNADLLIGKKGSPSQLLLYSLFRMGGAVENISYNSYQQICQDDKIKFCIPISLGDSHKGFRVMGTNENFFNNYQFGNDQKLHLAKGSSFSKSLEVVIGHFVAEKLNYNIGSEIVLAHGIAKNSMQIHDQHNFKVVGILKATGTPIDHTIHTNLSSIEIIHRKEISSHVTPKQISSFIVALKNKFDIFSFRSEINQYKEEALTAIMPAATLLQFWKNIDIIESAMSAVSIFVILTGFIALLCTLLSSLEKRRREISILRTLGAGKYYVFKLLCLESFFCAFAGSVGAVFLLPMVYTSSQSFMLNHFGLRLDFVYFSTHTLVTIIVISLAGLATGLIPAIKAYKYSLSDGLKATL